MALIFGCYRRRYDFHSHCRRLEENDFDISDEEKTDSDSEVDETMEYEVPKIRKPRAYKDQIMLSEWLVEVPTDFDTSWLMVPCPVGKRCLIVASRVSVECLVKFFFSWFFFHLGFHKSLFPFWIQSIRIPITTTRRLFKKYRKQYLGLPLE